MVLNNISDGKNTFIRQSKTYIAHTVVAWTQWKLWKLWAQRKHSPCSMATKGGWPQASSIPLKYLYMSDKVFTRYVAIYPESSVKLGWTGLGLGWTGQSFFFIFFQLC